MLCGFLLPAVRRVRPRRHGGFRLHAHGGPVVRPVAGAVGQAYGRADARAVPEAVAAAYVVAVVRLYVGAVQPAHFLAAAVRRADVDADGAANDPADAAAAAGADAVSDDADAAHGRPHLPRWLLLPRRQRDARALSQRHLLGQPIPADELERLPQLHGRILLPASVQATRGALPRRLLLRPRQPRGAAVFGRVPARVGVPGGLGVAGAVRQRHFCRGLWPGDVRQMPRGALLRGGGGDAAGLPAGFLVPHGDAARLRAPLPAGDVAEPDGPRLEGRLLRRRRRVVLCGLW
mmetsp:Transcript_28918/g.97513  ORF Transcript_28918/g.97513 Transcript_28918/m.97513 type:complete len:291 (-) Transcript_28918:963-1835(-)